MSYCTYNWPSWFRWTSFSNPFESEVLVPLMNHELFLSTPTHDPWNSKGFWNVSKDDKEQTCACLATGETQLRQLRCRCGPIQGNMELSKHNRQIKCSAEINVHWLVLCHLSACSVRKNHLFDCLADEQERVLLIMGTGLPWTLIPQLQSLGHDTSWVLQLHVACPSKSSRKWLC